MRPLSLILAACTALAGAGTAAAQDAKPISHRLLITRTDLERHLEQLREAALTPKRGGLTPKFLQAETTYVQQRLAQGDFRVGDRLLIEVEDPGPVTALAAGTAVLPITSMEQQLTDTFTVGSNQELTLPSVGVVSLRGVLRAELEPFLTAQIARTIRDPVVHARALISLSVSGGVVKPGYYTVPANSVLPAVMTAAGGAIKGGRLDDASIRRGSQVLYDVKAVRQAVAEGRTIDEMDLRPGDQIVIPEAGTTTSYEVLRFTAVLLSIPISLYTLGQIMKH